MKKVLYLRVLGNIPLLRCLEASVFTAHCSESAVTEFLFAYCKHRYLGSVGFADHYPQLFNLYKYF